MRVAPQTVLTEDERSELLKLTTSRLTSVRLSQRAQIVPLAAEGMQNLQIAEQLARISHTRAAAAPGPLPKRAKRAHFHRLAVTNAGFALNVIVIDRNSEVHGRAEGGFPGRLPCITLAQGGDRSSALLDHG